MLVEEYNMVGKVDFENKDIIRHISNNTTAHIDIPKEQFYLYVWAVAYESLEPIVEDKIYDMQVRYLERQQLMFPEVWEQCSMECFRDGSWKYTGMFIEAHNKEDEDWLL